ncbi:polyprenyl synthetase family protein [Hippea alviniae]|uniref:polyprenyl synthetase family protein n=1 Tax=Hippea alviniae TaxID=1279027 RepID=UPI0003B59556|nr:polyprenyl synthetase family protein [Hippea alviniae]
MDIRILNALKSDIKNVDRTLEALIKPESDLTKKVYKQVIDGGKRLRPLLVLYSAYSLGFGDEKKALLLGSIIELVHTASLLHDDIIDEALYRRGRPSANAIYGVKPAVLGGDYLYSLAYNLVLEFGQEISSVISKAAYVLSEGEILEIEKAFNVDVKREDYLDIIYKKTAVLIEASTTVGCLLADKSFKDVFVEYGKNVGMAFQIKDDCLDYMSDKESVGKDTGIDLKEGKMTLPVLIALEKGVLKREAVKEFFESKDEQLLSEIVEIVKRNSLDESIEIAKNYASKAKDALKSLKDSKFKEYLLAIADYSIERSK